MSELDDFYAQIAGAAGRPVARSFAETADAVFRAQDIEARAEQRRRAQQTAEVRTPVDLADLAALGLVSAGRTPAQVLADAAASTAEEDAWADWQATLAERKRERERDARLARAEADLDMAHAATARSARDLTRANEGWARARGGSSFRAAPQSGGIRPAIGRYGPIISVR